MVVASNLDSQRGSLVALRGITKSFYGALANDGVDFTLAGGEIHALLGENGAGKSTLMNVLTGLYQPDAGTILIEGHPRRIESPSVAIATGIGMVHQHFKLVPAFTVAENIHLGWSETPWRASASVLEARTAALVRRFGLTVVPSAHVADISAGEQQRVEILRVLARGARILILDEPTAVLTPAEVQVLFAALRAFRAEGNSVILISHKLGEVMEIADHVTVMRAGRSVASLPTAGASRASLARLIIGETSLPTAPEAGQGVCPDAPVLLELQGVTVRDSRRIVLLDGIDLQVRAGEVLGIAGVAGNGQRALSEVLTGCLRPDEGLVLVDGVPVAQPDARDFAERGIGHIPEDRLKTALAADLSLAENAVLREYARPPVSHGIAFRPGRARILARRIIDDAELDRRDPDMPVRNLSGGNQQRLVAQRETRIASRVLVAAYPTRGLDIGAVATLHAAMHRLSAQGVGVVLISEEIEELLEHADRIAVLFAGRIAGILPAAEADPERLGLLMSGQTASHPAGAIAL
ncbi:ABC transporter ATP-binding protein [Lichenicola cladoniae]|uniref:ABC transporter ATP-binding protein n=1 Tax=Lichenicola cladoniae TaxID=1484109 RepID=UPI001EF574CA|nr:ABC transporter ATP-binding protein [Lichenicola cladoniae]